MKLALSALIILIFSSQVHAEDYAEDRLENQAEEEVVHGFTAEQSNWMASQNKKESLKEAFKIKPIGGIDDDQIRPYAEYKDQGYFIFSDKFNFNSQPAKKGFLQNLPDSIIPVVFTQNQSPEYVQALKERFGSYMVKNQEKLKIMYLKGTQNAFWSRDHIPVPMYYNDQGKDQFMVVDAKYYYYFEPDEQVAKHFNALIGSHDYYFEGGNFVANDLGDCLVVDNERVEKMPNSVFEAQYGCKQLIRLSYLRGIGHADESVKFVDDKLVLTDLLEYKEILEEKGFQVVMLPRAKGRYETYLNSVILEDTIYVPVFGNEKDEEALAVYRNLGYKPVPLDSKILSNRGLGSLHCISMVYPKVEYTELVEGLGGEEI